MFEYSLKAERVLASVKEYDGTAPAELFDKYCRIYKDGNHLVASRIIENKFKKVRVKKVVDYEMRKTIEAFYYECVEKGIIKWRKKREYIYNRMLEMYPDCENLKKIVYGEVHRIFHNYYIRLKRLKRKASLNDWNYFVTFTYDDKKHNAKSFREKLKKCLSNLSTRRGWRYMGVFELSPEKERLHFHAIMFIPENEMIGELYEKSDYSTKQHKMQTILTNSFFNDKFGRSDFKKITNVENSLNYLTKYLEKSGEKLVYSRRISSEILAMVDNEDVACEFTDFVIKMVLFDDVMDKYINYKPHYYNRFVYNLPEKVQECMFEDNKPTGYLPPRVTRATPNYNYITNLELDPLYK